jgi:hypothetical protein
MIISVTNGVTVMKNVSANVAWGFEAKTAPLTVLVGSNELNSTACLKS